MKILVTAGNTQTPIDRVRSISNIFTGKTGTLIALEAYRRDHSVELLTSHPELISSLVPDLPPSPAWVVHCYRTFDDLANLMEERIRNVKFDAIIHCAAVSDYRVEGIYTLGEGVSFDPNRSTWNSSTDAVSLIDVTQGKVKSNHPEIWFRMLPTVKLIDQIRPWGFAGVLVKFKLEVQKNHEELIEIAKRSREQSDADLIVANTLEAMQSLAWIVDRKHESEEVVRMSLPRRLLERVEALVKVHFPL
jgi:phosphopantothenate-cysteine ligase/phosphopantothenoylcysteine decarboxylase/phosphopantothenate--cysteine ligase